jgi:hypothetical protein
MIVYYARNITLIRDGTYSSYEDGEGGLFEWPHYLVPYTMHSHVISGSFIAEKLYVQFEMLEKWWLMRDSL